MGYKTHSIDGKMGEISLAHVRTQTKSVVIPAGTNGTYGLAWLPVAATITAVRIYRSGGSAASVQIKNNTSDVLAAPLASGTDAWTQTTTVQNAAVAAGGSILAVLSAAAGTPASVTVQVDFLIAVPA
ncbi:hypothetical protein ABZ470_39475 [Streptosporangium sp. NPDC020072]|uniref:hypothetical protein n=1 Tax=Streptosporangium sp. NPDC020072 TaxID=3154788 RepID=UPI0034240357